MPRRRRIHVTLTWLWPALLAAGLLVLVAAGASAAFETNTVASYWRGLWWSLSLITTVGFIGEPPETVAGAVLSTCLMVFGFLLLAMVSASLAAMFVREEERPRDTREEATDQAIIEALTDVQRRLESIERALQAPDN
jgi:voltage-gated potassium channel